MKAALYLRSSKDRSDVSIAAQRRELQQLATSRKLSVVTEFCDVVESAKSEHRPAFQDLLRAMKDPARDWDTLLVLDTSRLSRRRYVAQVFKHEARRRGVEILYARLPETDPIVGVVLESVFEAFDEVHSLMSRDKGLAGMRENVQQGYRAGGRAPRGYRLVRHETGATRDGQAVTKTTLEPSEDARQVARYLKARAKGQPRSAACRDEGVPWPASSMVGVEWNALTYAGHTVWNRHNEKQPGGGYKGGTKMRPRSEWMIQRDTHPALITDDEAESILHQLETSTRGAAAAAGRRGMSRFLLTGLLASPDDRMWEGHGMSYRLKAKPGLPGRYVSQQELERAVVDQIVRDLQSDKMVDAFLLYARQRSGAPDPAAEDRATLAQVEKDISKAADLALRLEDPEPMLAKVDELRARRDRLRAEIERVGREAAVDRALGTITRAEIRMLIRGLGVEIESSRTKQMIQQVVDRITLDPKTFECQIQYRVATDTLLMASPRGCLRWGVHMEWTPYGSQAG